MLDKDIQTKGYSYYSRDDMPGLFDFIATSLIAASTYHCSAMTYKEKIIVTMQDGFIDFEFKSDTNTLRFRPYNLVTDSFKNITSDKIIFRQLSSSEGTRHMESFETNRLLFNQYQIQSYFTNYYELYVNEIKEKFGDNPADWHTVWDFARVVRNSFSHGNKIDIRGSRNVTCNNYELSSEDNNEIFFPELFNMGDLFYLTIEMESIRIDKQIEAINF